MGKTILHVAGFEGRDEALDHYLHAIDVLADEVRIESPGQSAIHALKYQEALAGGGELLEAEAKATGQLLADVVARVLAARQEWQALSIKAEAARIAAKQDVRGARTPEEMFERAQRYRRFLENTAK